MNERGHQEGSPAYRRLVLSFHDIDEAVGLASALRRSVEAPVPVPAERRLLRQAMSAAFVIAYMRPFKQSRGDGETARLVSLGDVLTLTEAQRGLHTRLERLRDNIVAHADPQPRQLCVDRHSDLGLVPTSRNVDVEFSPEGAAELQQLAESVRTWIDGQLVAAGTSALAQE